MKKTFVLFTVLCFTLSACIPAILQPQPTSPAPSAPEADIQATVAAQVEQTVQSLPSPTLLPTNTPVVITATSAPTQTQPPPTSTVTPNPTQPTLTVAPISGTGTMVVTVGTVGTLPSTATLNPAITVTPTGTSHYQYYGTMPPNLPSGSIALYNKSKADAYISLQCTTVDGYVTIIEYPVGSAVGFKAPAGDYIYVAWVGGKKFTGSFKLGKLQDRRVYMYKDRVEIK
jgi:hypothetical protein